MSGGNDAKVLLDLNFPSFQTELFSLDIAELRKIFKTFRKLHGLTWNQVFRDLGLHWEEIRSVGGKYSIRLSRSYRAVVAREGASMRFIALHLDHDGAYGKK
jgi:hypothetical protein